MTANIGAFWDITSEAKICIEAVLRLNNLGAVVIHATHATSQEGVEIESSEIILLTVEDDKINRCELFDDADIEAALARFDELQLPTRQLENAASQVAERFQACLASEDWPATAKMLAEDIVTDDRRRVVGAGVQRGRDVNVGIMPATLDIGIENVTSTVIATRGERLVLGRVHFSGRDRRPEPFRTELLRVLEIDAEERIAARVFFDPDDFTAAFEELDARYLAGEAAAHSRTWSIISGAYAALDRGEIPAATQDWLHMDHRLRATIEAKDLSGYLRAAWGLTPNLTIYIEAVHRLSDVGAVVTHASHGTSQDGFNAEWRMIGLVTVDGHKINRSELFEEADLDAALARFEELGRSAPLLENAATRIWARVADAFNRRDLDGFLALYTADARTHDRRKGFQAVIDGSTRRKHTHVMFELTPTNWPVEVQPIATRGSRLSLTRLYWVDTEIVGRPVTNEALAVAELSYEGLIHETVDFDPADLDAAFEELEARYLAGEAAAHAQAWSVIAQAFAALNRHELPPTTPDWVNLDHRAISNDRLG